MNYDAHMRKCIELAKQGEGRVSPNPLVGCVVLDSEGKEISTGYHPRYGEAHAEADALNKLKNGEAKGGTLIVNLEPCSHWGKTPPCADLIVKHGLKTLVIGMQDPNPLVAGNGIKICRNAGIQVIEDVLSVEAMALNEVFIKNMTLKSIFVALKTATTLDGKIATSSGDSKWITSDAARAEVQKIRNRYDAIMTTSSTAIRDNPSLDCRLDGGRNPHKIVLDRDSKTDFGSKIYTNQSENSEKTFIVVDENIDKSRLLGVPEHVQIIKCPVNNSKLDLEILFKKLFELNIMSVLIEAGGKLNGEVVSLGLVDKIYQFIAPKILADKTGISAFEGRQVDKIEATIDFELEDVVKFSPDCLLVLKKI